MRPQSKTSWLLEGRLDWRTGHREGVSVGAEIRLAASSDPRGPLGLLSGDGSVGGLVLPRGIAVDERGVVYLLGPDEPWLKRIDPAIGIFKQLEWTGGEGTDPRQFHQPGGIGIVGSQLCVADTGNARVQVFSLASLALQRVFKVAGSIPVDVATSGDQAYFLHKLDTKEAQIHAYRAGTDDLTTVFTVPGPPQRWSRLLVDREGRFYLLDATVPQLEIFDRSGTSVGTVSAADDVRDRFPAPEIRMDQKGRFKPPAKLARQCGVLPGIDQLVFDRQGRAVRIPKDEPAGPRPYGQSGVWISKELDSAISKCQWHRIEMELGDLPPGTVVAVSTWTSETPKPLQDVLATAEWKSTHRVVGPMQPGVSSTPKTHEVLVTSDGGRFLWLKLELSGDGYASAAVKSLRVHYPRQSYLENLPAIYQAEEDSRRFVERFLSIAQAEWDPLETSIAEISRYFDPRTVPDGPFLDYLARWLALPLEGSWTYAQKRHLLRAAPGFTGRAGTLGGIHDYLRAYLEAMREEFSEHSGEKNQPDVYPRLVEGFRERDRLMLSVRELGQLGSIAPLWSPSAVARLQLDVFAREGEARMVSTGDPERDLFHEFSHRFRVFVPSAWVRTGEEERMIRRAVEAVKPSQAAYDLCLVEPRFRIALQSTVGIDTILGPYPRARLACTHEADPPPSRPPRYRLGYDTILAAEPGRPAFEIKPGLRVGMETILT